MIILTYTIMTTITDILTAMGINIPTDMIIMDMVIPTDTITTIIMDTVIPVVMITRTVTSTIIIMIITTIIITMDTIMTTIMTTIIAKLPTLSR